MLKILTNLRLKFKKQRHFITQTFSQVSHKLCNTILMLQHIFHIKFKVRTIQKQNHSAIVEIFLKQLHYNKILTTCAVRQNYVKNIRIKTEQRESLPYLNLVTLKLPTILPTYIWRLI